MATRKTSTSNPSGNADPSAQFQDAVSQAVQGATERLQSLNLTGTAAALMENGRKDIEALVEANKRSYQGLQTVVQRQTEGLRQSITQWQSAVSGMPGQDLTTNLSKLDEMGKAAFAQAISDMRELAEAAAKSQSEAFDIVRQRIQENVDQVSQLLQQGGGKKK
ncbi:MAG: phasin [Comamonadaceae bacterium]|nr:MAG: phasin [Comamonadaceae bacterium]